MPLRMGVRTVGALGSAGCDLSHESLEAIGSLIAISISALTRSKSLAGVKPLGRVIVCAPSSWIRSQMNSARHLRLLKHLPRPCYPDRAGGGTAERPIAGDQ